MDRQVVDHMMRTRNFRVRNEVVERGAVTKSSKGKKAYVERKLGECFQWNYGDEKDDRLLPHQIRRPRLTNGEKIFKKHHAKEREALQTKGTKCHACTKIVKTRRVNLGTCPCVKTTSARPDAHLKEHVSSDMLRQRKPTKKSKKGGAKGSGALLKESTHLGCASQDSYPRNFILREEGKLGSNAPSNAPKAPGTNEKLLGKRIHREENLQKCEPHERSPCSQKFGERSHEETLQQEGCARRVALDLATIICKPQECGQSCVLPLLQ